MFSTPKCLSMQIVWSAGACGYLHVCLIKEVNDNTCKDTLIHFFPFPLLGFIS